MNGATPVPGPMSSRGHLWLAGGRKSRVARRKIGIFTAEVTSAGPVAEAPARSSGWVRRSSQFVHSPRRRIPVAPTAVSTIVIATVKRCAFARGDDAIE